jgi:hypothetical protein
MNLGKQAGLFLASFFTLKIEVTSVEFKPTTRRYIPEEKGLHNHRCKNLLLSS